MNESALAVIERLRQATEDHDLDAIVECFSEDYANETPAHPARGFVGREQVRTNWSRILGAVPDLSASVLRSAVEGDAVWAEWEMRGTRVDGVPHLLRGVIIFGVRDGAITWARFYLEPVDEADADVNAAVGRTIGDPAR
jgi:ketosteroid isomerase-like protein